MAEYISREELLEHLNKRMNEPIYDPDMSWICAAIVTFVENMKAADVQPVKHGQWNEIYHDIENYSAICTYCQEPTVRRVWFRQYDFCPHCGAIMDLKEGEKNAD